MRSMKKLHAVAGTAAAFALVSLFVWQQVAWHRMLAPDDLRLLAHMPGNFYLRRALRQIVPFKQQAGRIHNRELPTIPLAIAVQPVASSAGDIFDDRLALADQPVEKSRFADVGPAYECNYRFHIFTRTED